MSQRLKPAPEAAYALDLDHDISPTNTQSDLRHGLSHAETEAVDGPYKALLEFRIHLLRLLIASVVLSVLLATITFALERGSELATVQPDEALSWSLLKSSSISQQVDELNSYSGRVASALGAFWTFALQLIVYVIVLAIVPALMVDNTSV